MNIVHKSLKKLTVLTMTILFFGSVLSFFNVIRAADESSTETVAGDKITYTAQEVVELAVNDYEIIGIDSPLGFLSDIVLDNVAYPKNKTVNLVWSSDSPNLKLNDRNSYDKYVFSLIPDENNTVTAVLKVEADLFYNETHFTASKIFNLKIAKKVNLIDYDGYLAEKEGNPVNVQGYIYAIGDLDATYKYKSFVIKAMESDNYYLLNNVITTSKYSVGQPVEILGLKTKKGSLGIDAISYSEFVITNPVINILSNVENMNFPEVSKIGLESFLNQQIYTQFKVDNVTYLIDGDKQYFQSGQTKVEIVKNAYANESLLTEKKYMVNGEKFNVLLMLVKEDGILKAEPFNSSSIIYLDSDYKEMFDFIIKAANPFAPLYDENITGFDKLNTSTTINIIWSSDSSSIKFRVDGTGTNTAIIKVPNEGEKVVNVTLTAEKNGKTLSKTFTLNLKAGKKQSVKKADYVFLTLIIIALLAIPAFFIVSYVQGKNKSEIRRKELQLREDKARASRSEAANKQLENLSGITKK